MNTLISLIGIASILSTPLGALAASPDECRTEMNFQMAREQRLYRAHLFGKKNAKDAAVGEVRYDNEGISWIKQDNSGTPWATFDPNNSGLKWSNFLMDQEDENAPILPLKGIFETKRMMTSELIPYALQSIRALECRLESLCDIIEISALQTTETPVRINKVQPFGCTAFADVYTLSSCHFSEPDENILSQTDSKTYCSDVSRQLLQREVELLKLTVEYDAGYRTLMQFAGNFDIFLREMRWPLTTTLRQAVQLIGQLQRIPCFISSCDASPKPKVQ